MHLPHHAPLRFQLLQKLSQVAVPAPQDLLRAPQPHLMAEDEEEIEKMDQKERHLDSIANANTEGFTKSVEEKGIIQGKMHRTAHVK